MNSCNAVSKVLTSMFNMLLPDFTITFHLKTSSLPHSLFLGVYTLLHEINVHNPVFEQDMYT